MKPGWWYATLRLWDLAKTICLILTMEGSPFCFHGGSLAVMFLPQLPTHLTPLSHWAQPLQISTQALPRINSQPQQSTNNLLHRLQTFTLLLPLGRYPAPASLQNLPFFFLGIHQHNPMVAIVSDTFATRCNPIPANLTSQEGPTFW